MRIRSTKPEFWRSKTIAQLDWDTRLVLKALESYVDDDGVGKDSVVIFCTDAFPYDVAKSPEIFAKVSRSLSRLSEADLIVRYTVGGEDLIYVRWWKKWQYIDKPKAGRYPRPDGTMDYRDTVDESICAGQEVSPPQNREASPGLRETFAKTSPKPDEECPQIQSGEQGNRGTGEVVGCVENVSTDRDGENLSARSATPGAELVREIIPAGHPSATLTALRIRSSELLRQGHSRADVAAALQLWCDKPSLGPNTLPSLLSEVIKSRAAPGGPNGKPASKMRALAELAAEVRAVEQAQTDTSRKELA